MKIRFSERAWNDYRYWQEKDRKMLKKINALLTEITRQAYTGTGKPEALRYDLSGLWSRRIDQEHRLVYRVEEDEVQVHSCRMHY